MLGARWVAGRLLGLVLAMLAAAGGAGTGTTVGQSSTPVPVAAASAARVFTIPGDAVFPDGIAYDPATDLFYVGGTGDGSIFRGDRATGAVSLLVTGAGHTPVGGLRVDGHGRILVAGQHSGTVYVYDAASGALLGAFHTKRSANTFLSDLAVAPNGDVWVVDALSPMLFKIPAAALPEPGNPRGTPTASEATNLNVGIDLSGSPFPLGPGFNATGIVVTPDGRYALVGHAASGTLYRVDLEQRSVVRVDVGGATFHGSGGLALDDHTLYVVHQGVISPVGLNLDYRRGVAGPPISDASFNAPTRIALAGPCLLVVNSQFRNRAKGPTLPFTVSEVPIPGKAQAAGASSC